MEHNTKYFKLDQESYIVSIPRSGQGIVWGFLINIYNKYLMSNYDTKFGVCDFYKCCGLVPCKFQKSIHKNHDFDLNTILLCPEKKKKYLILYRNDYILSLEACFRFKYMNIVKDFDYSKNKVLLLSLIRFILRNKNKYYDAFTKKYGIEEIQKNGNDFNSNIIAFDYYDLVKNPDNNLKAITKFFFGSKISDNDTTVFINEYKKQIKIRHTLDQNIYKLIKKTINNYYLVNNIP